MMKHFLLWAVVGLTATSAHARKAPSRNDAKTLRHVLYGGRHLNNSRLLQGKTTGKLHVSGRKPRPIQYGNSRFAPRFDSQDALRRVGDKRPARVVVRQVYEDRPNVSSGSNTVLRQVWKATFSNRKLPKMRNTSGSIQVVADAPVGSKVQLGRTTVFVDRRDGRMKSGEVRVKEQRVVTSGNYGKERILIDTQRTFKPFGPLITPP